VSCLNIISRPIRFINRIPYNPNSGQQHHFLSFTSSNEASPQTKFPLYEKILSLHETWPQLPKSVVKLNKWALAPFISHEMFAQKNYVVYYRFINNFLTSK